MPRVSITHYHALHPDQRFVAAVMARSRGDDAEFERLVNTCPRHTYRMTDPAFTKLADKAYSIVRMIGSCIERECARLSVLDVLSEPLTELVDMLIGSSREARGLPRKAEPENPLPAELEQWREWWEGAYAYPHTMMPVLHEVCARSIVIYWETFEQFCGECIRLAPEAVMQAVLNEEGIAYLLAQVERACADVERIEQRPEPLRAPMPERSPDLLPDADALLEHMSHMWGHLDWESARHPG